MNISLEPRGKSEYVVVLNTSKTGAMFRTSDITAMDEGGHCGVTYTATLMAHRMFCRHLIQMDEIDAVVEEIKKEINLLMGRIAGW